MRRVGDTRQMSSYPDNTSAKQKRVEHFDDTTLLHLVDATPDELH